MDPMARMATYETEQLWWTYGIHSSIYHKDIGVSSVTWEV